MRYLLALTAALALAASIGTGSAAASTTHHCARVDITTPNGPASATHIRAKNVTCKHARKIARRCLNGSVPSGWAGTIDTKGLMHVTYYYKTVVFSLAGSDGCSS